MVLVAQVMLVQMAKADNDIHIKKRFKSLDAFRGLAILLILCLHVLPHYIENSFFLSILKYGKIGTDIFFVISGFSVAIACHKIINSDRRPIEFILPRFKKIYLVYFFSLVTALIIFPSITPLISYLKSGVLEFSYHKYSIIYWVKLITLVQVFESESWHLHRVFQHNGVYWFIAVIVQIYLFLGLALFFKKAFNYIVFFTFILSCLCLIPSIKSYIPYGLFLPKYSEFFLGMLLFFLLNKYQTLRVSAPVWLVLGTIVLGFFTFMGSFQNDVYRLLSALFMTAVFLCIYPYDDNISAFSIVKGFRRLGGFSYSLFLMHVPLAIVIQMFIRNLIPLPNYISAPLILVPSIVICSYIWYIFFEYPGSVKGTLQALYSPIASVKKRLIKVHHRY